MPDPVVPDVVASMQEHLSQLEAQLNSANREKESLKVELAAARAPDRKSVV